MNDEKRTLTKEEIGIIEKISDIFSMDASDIEGLITNSIFKIRILDEAKGISLNRKDAQYNDEKTDKGISEKIMSIDTSRGSLIREDSYNCFFYSGDLNWHELVNKMIKMGFRQSPDFDVFCRSLDEVF
jgi:hypothetical protein